MCYLNTIQVKYVLILSNMSLITQGPSGHHYYLDTIGNTNYVYCTQIVLYNAFKIGKETPKQDVSNLSKLQTRLETLNADPCVYISFIVSVA